MLNSKYSILLCGGAADSLTQEEMTDYIKKGVKVLLLVIKKRVREYSALAKEYGEAGLFRLYEIDDNAGPVPDFAIADGIVENKNIFAKICERAKSFNFEQYMVEHAPLDSERSIVVRASAGTGKTTVMIDRVMFIFSMRPELKPEDITMITFTNAAADNMLEKIIRKLSCIYQITGMVRYLNLLEQISSMQISTIDSFFRKVISAGSMELGYGANVQVRGFIWERKEILRQVINDVLQRQHFQGSFLENCVLPQNEYIEMAMDCWDKLNGCGIYYQELAMLDFGYCDDQRQMTVNNILKIIVLEAERRYQQLKREQNAISINDLKADTEILTKTNAKLRALNIKFLFVDEFQDTDTSQIRSIVALQKKLDCQLFAVGDIKQSIYRFRGADESAFDYLEKILLTNNLRISEFILQKNYRTSDKIIQPLNVFFANLRGADLLQWDSAAVAGRNFKGTFKRYLFAVEKNQYGTDMYSPVKKHVLGILKKRKKGHICFLARMNYQVAEIASWCRSAGVPCIAKLEGGFYKHQAVQDVMYVLGAIIYSGDNRYLFNAAITPYLNCAIDLYDFNEIAGNNEKVRNKLMTEMEKRGWNYIVDISKEKTFFQLFRMLLNEFNPIEGYRRKQEAELKTAGFSGPWLKKQLEYDVASYRLNLNKLAQIIYDNFQNEVVSVLTVYDFLRNKASTNKEEDTVYPVPENDGNLIVEIMTVHKAKGMEFPTVIITHTAEHYIKDLDFLRSRYCQFITPTAGEHRFGWFLQNERGEQFMNSWFREMLGRENMAISRDEARILYVAMTRAQEELIVYQPEFKSITAKENTWGEMLELMDKNGGAKR